LELGQPSAANEDDVVLAAHGDTAAFERVYRRHFSRVYGLAVRMVGGDDADDAVQDIFFRAWTKLGSYRREASFATWLYRLALNVLVRRAEGTRNIKRTSVAISEETAVANAPTLDAGLDIEAALSSLSPDLRAAVVLHDMEGYSHEEVGELLNISLTAARMRLFRGRMALRVFGSRDR